MKKTYNQPISTCVDYYPESEIMVIVGSGRAENEDDIPTRKRDMNTNGGIWSGIKE